MKKISKTLPLLAVLPSGTITPPDPSIGINGILNNALTFIGIPLFAAVLGGFIYAGYLFMTSQGQPEKLGTAKKSLTFSIIGLLVFIFSYIIITYVIGELK